MPIVTRRKFLTQSTQVVMGAGFFGTGVITMSGCNSNQFDIIIKNGWLYDGTGAEPRQTDLGIRADKIAAISDLSAASGHRVLDANGQAVCPGFIDIHTHTDIQLLVNPKAESKIRQGVTIEIGGNCGDSIYPLDGETGQKVRDEIRKEYAWEIDWQDLRDFYHRLHRQGIALNYATLVGHGAIRTAAMGIDNRDPSASEMQQMKKLLRAAMEQGALGLSTGLEYTPGSFAKTAEIVELCKIVAEHGGLYATHMRNEDLTAEQALEETLLIARESGVKLQISHLKASQKRNWHKTPLLLQQIQLAADQGMNVHADRYPYTAYSTSLKMLFPLWAREGKDDDFVARLKDQAQWLKILPFVQDKIAALGSWASVLITNLASQERKAFQGKRIEQLAVEMKQDPFEFTRELLIAENGQVGMCGFGMSEEDTEKILAFPLTMIGSDGDAISPYGKLGQGKPHPRCYGTFPRYLGHYVRERKILPLAEAIRRITSLPAQKLGLKNRGVLKTGFYADMVIFDPKAILDKATFVQPHQYSEGIEFVIVNGKIAVEKGEHTGELAGRVLTS